MFGEYIDSTLGAYLSLSTLMAAGLGNAVADVLGIGFGQTIEALSSKLGLPNPNVCGKKHRNKQTNKQKNVILWCFSYSFRLSVFIILSLFYLIYWWIS